MKRNYLLLLITLFFSINSNAKESFELRIKGNEAKKLYDFMTDKHVLSEGGAGHIYRQGKNVLCSYVEVDMDDKQGKAVPLLDARRYACVIHFSHQGL